MNIQKLKDDLFEFGKVFGFSKYDGLNIADLADLLIRLNEVVRTALHRIEVILDERGEQTTPVFVEPGVTVKEVGLGESIRPETEANSATAVVIEGPKGKMYLTKAGFAELARRGLVRCRACESWLAEVNRCNETKLNAGVAERDTDGVGFGDYPNHDPDFGPDFGCIHFKPSEEVWAGGAVPGSERCLECEMWSFAGCLIRKRDPHIDGCEEFAPKER